MNKAGKRVKMIIKIRILQLSQNPRFMLISALSAPTEPKFNALAWKMPQEWPKCKK